MGGGAALLGLTSGPTTKAATTGSLVTEQDLRAVLRGYAPVSSPVRPGAPLNGRYYAPGIRRCAYDLVLSGHKSISLAALCLPDDHLNLAMGVRHAWVRALADSVTYIEYLAHRGNGRGKNVQTGNLLIAAFTHFASRRNDPHLHNHLILANATYDGTNQGCREWYALEPVHIYRQLRQIDAVFQRELHRHLVQLGYESRMVQVDGITVASLPIAQSVCERASKAHHAIVATTAGHWARQDRTLADRRVENLLNDRLRPSKKGLLVARAEAFERALSEQEALEVVHLIGGPRESTEIPLIVPQMPPRKDLDRLVRKADQSLGICGEPTLKHLATAALVASRTSELPFHRIYEHARRRLSDLRTLPMRGQHLEDYTQAQHRFWFEQPDWFGLQMSDKYLPPINHTLVLAAGMPSPVVQTPVKSPPPRESDSGERHVPWRTIASERRLRLREKIAHHRIVREAVFAVARTQRATGKSALEQPPALELPATPPQVEAEQQTDGEKLADPDPPQLAVPPPAGSLDPPTPDQPTVNVHPYWPASVQPPRKTLGL